MHIQIVSFVIENMLFEDNLEESENFALEITLRILFLFNLFLWIFLVWILDNALDNSYGFLYIMDFSCMNSWQCSWILMDLYVFDNPYSYGSLVEMIISYFGCKFLWHRHVNHEHHITINLDVNGENGWFRKSVFVNSKMRHGCRLSNKLTILVSWCSNIFLVCYFHF